AVEVGRHLYAHDDGAAPHRRTQRSAAVHPGSGRTDADSAESYGSRVGDARMARLVRPSYRGIAGEDRIHRLLAREGPVLLLFLQHPLGSLVEQALSMIKLPLIALLLFCALYGWRQRPLSPIVGFLTPLTCGVGIALVIRPDWSSEAARLLGV